MTTRGKPLALDESQLENVVGGRTPLNASGAYRIHDYTEGSFWSEKLDGREDRRDIMNGHHGNDTLDGRSGNDSLQGGEGNDSLIGGAGDDRLEGGAGQDSLSGGAGDDLIVWRPGHGNDVVEGGEGRDTLHIAIPGFSYDTVNVFASGGGHMPSEWELGLDGSIDFQGPMSGVLEFTTPQGEQVRIEFSGIEKITFPR
jgi:Ca2+-binding RTX toxin-like protein